MGYAVRMELPLLQVPERETEWGYPSAAAFAVAERWLGETLPDDQGPAALALRYFAAFGPASARDFQTWSGFSGATAIVEAMRDQLRTFRDERGRELFDLPKAPRPDEDIDVPIRFLPEYDNLLLAHSDRARIIDDEYRPLVYRANLLIPGTFLVDGWVAGTWHADRKKREARLTFSPFVRLSRAARQGVEAEADRLLRFIHPDASVHAVDSAPVDR